MANGGEEQLEEDEPGMWLVGIYGDSPVLIGFLSQHMAAVAYAALSLGVVMEAEGAKLTLEHRDENSNWIVWQQTRMK